MVFKKRNIPWNKRLTKEVDERVKKQGQTHKKNYREGKWKSWNKGLTKETDERVKKNAENIPTKFKKGHPKYGNYKIKKGQHISPITEYKKGHKETKEIREKRLKNLFKAVLIKPNKSEKLIINLIKENNLPFNYVGDGKINFGGFCPDFLSKNSKYIIEIFGNYWHNKPEVKKRDKRKLKTYKRLGYKPLIIWEHKLQNPFQVLNKIKKFIK